MSTFSESLMCYTFCLLGICYGFEIMRDHESPDIPFTILRTRFPEGMVMMYDYIK